METVTTLYPKELARLESVIRQRFSLQTNEKALEKFGLTPVDLVVSKNKIVDIYKNLHPDKKNKFISLIGGPANFDKTKAYIEAL